mgnify:CR=1 FL=1
MGSPRAWQQGDPVGTGRVHLPDTETRNAYMRECERQKAIPGWVRYVLAGDTRERRRERLIESPDDLREDVRARATERFEREKNNGRN